MVLEYVLPQGNGQDVVMETSKSILKTFPLFTLLLLCLFQPIIEEFAFRYWGKGKLYARIVSTVGIGIFTILECGLLGLVFTGLTVYLMFFFKSEKHKTPVLMVFTSAVFALMHVSGFSAFSLEMVIGIANIFGMALVMSYVVVNYRFVYSCMIHVLNNSLALLIPMLIFSNGEVKTFKADNLSAELKPSSVFDDNSEINYDKYVYSGELPKIAYNIACNERAGEDEDSNILFRYELDNSQLWSEYHFRISCNPIGSPTRTELLDMLYQCDLQSDTTYEHAYVISISDPSKTKRHNDDIDGTTSLSAFAKILKTIYSIPVVLDCDDVQVSDNVYDCMYKAPGSMMKQIFEQEKDYKEMLNIHKKKEILFEQLEKEYGIKTEKSDTLEVPVITFKIKKQDD